MTKDLALLVGADQRWLSTTGFLDKVSDNLTKAMAAAKPPFATPSTSLPATNAKRLRKGAERRTIHVSAWGTMDGSRIRAARWLALIEN